MRDIVHSSITSVPISGMLNLIPFRTKPGYSHDCPPSSTRNLRKLPCYVPCPSDARVLRPFPQSPQLVSRYDVVPASRVRLSEWLRSEVTGQMAGRSRGRGQVRHVTWRTSHDVRICSRSPPLGTPRVNVSKLFKAQLPLCHGFKIWLFFSRDGFVSLRFADHLSLKLSYQSILSRYVALA